MHLWGKTLNSIINSHNSFAAQIKEQNKYQYENCSVLHLHVMCNKMFKKDRYEDRDMVNDQSILQAKGEC